MNYKHRLDQVRNKMVEKGIGMMFLGYGTDLWYLAGFNRRQPNQTDSNAYGDYVSGAYIGAEGGFTIVAPRMGGSFYEKEAEGKPWVDEVRIVDESQRPRDVLAEVVKRFHLEGKGIAMDDHAWVQTGLALQSSLPENDISLASDLIAPMRMIKDADEIVLMKEATQITDKAYEKIIDFLEIGVTEFDVAHELDYQFRKRGAEYPSFVTTIRFTRPGQGKVYGALKATDNVLTKGDAIAFDMGVCYRGYCSDFGRNVFVGQPPAEFCRIHDIVVEAQEKAVKAMVSGTITATQLDHVARTVIEKAGYGKAFTHRLGHGIGVTVHEPPYLYEPDETTLVSGMVFTVEPSIALSNSYSCRVEDVVMVTEKGGTLFSNFHKKLTIV
jgi:Xaa-Pro aminopeptidase